MSADPDAADAADPVAPAPVAPAQSKLELENQSLKRRLVQYAATLEQLTGHAKREISSSARARDDAIAAAADAAALRESMAETETALAGAEAARERADRALADREERVRDLEGVIAALEERVREGERDKGELGELRERLGDQDRQVEALREEKKLERDRAVQFEEELVSERGKLGDAERAAERLRELEAEREQVLQGKEQAERAAAEVATREAAAREQVTALEGKVAELEGLADGLRTELAQGSDKARVAEERVREVETGHAQASERVREVEAQAEETAAALRQELDAALKDLSDRNAEVDELKNRATREIESFEAIEERDALRCNVQELQEELEQSTEMLTRAAIDALGDKGRIRRLEEVLGKTRDELSGEKREKSSRESKIAGMVGEIGRLEREIDSLRSSKRSLADECHKYQMQIHEKDNIVATKSRELEELGTDRADRAFHADRLGLELSNAKNSLAKKESDFVKLSTEYQDVCEQLKSTAKDLEDRHVEIGNTRRELSQCNEQISELSQEKERLKNTDAELQVARRQVQELTTAAAEKDEELSTLKRWYSTLKTEAGEASREKKRLSEMLSDVSGDLKRANQELDLLRSMRKEQEVLAARISHIGETSSRELNLMKQTQTEQAQSLAKNTVDEYHKRIEQMQRSAKDDIAATVADQLRHDIMPHLMRAVDVKAKHMVSAFAKHVETFVTDETDTSFSSSKQNFPPSRPSNDAVDVDNAESLRPQHTNLATAYASASDSQSAPASAYRSAPPSYPQSANPSNFQASTSESPWNSVPDASRIEDSAEGSTADAGMPVPDVSPEPSVEQTRAFAETSPMASPSASGPEGQSDAGAGEQSEEDVTGEEPTEPEGSAGGDEAVGTRELGTEGVGEVEERGFEVAADKAAEADDERGEDGAAGDAGEEAPGKSADAAAEEIEELDITEDVDGDEDDMDGMGVEMEYEEEFVQEVYEAAIIEELGDDGDEYAEDEGDMGVARDDFRDDVEDDEAGSAEGGALESVDEEGGVDNVVYDGTEEPEPAEDIDAALEDTREPVVEVADEPVAEEVSAPAAEDTAVPEEDAGGEEQVVETEEVLGSGAGAPAVDDAAGDDGDMAGEEEDEGREDEPFAGAGPEEASEPAVARAQDDESRAEAAAATGGDGGAAGGADGAVEG